MREPVGHESDECGNKNQIEDENYPHSQPEEQFKSRQLESPVKMSPHEPGHRPQDQRDEHETERNDQHCQQQLAVLQRTHTLPDKEWIRQDHFHLTILIRFENQFVLSVPLEKRSWTDSLPMFGFAVRPGQKRH